MQRMYEVIFLILSTCLWIPISGVVVQAQCGADGLQPCIPVKAKIKPSKTSAAKPTISKRNLKEKNQSKSVNATGTATKNKPKAKSAKSNDESIYNSLKLKPQNTETETRNTPVSNELFPLYGVTLGETVEDEFIVLNGKRNEFAKEQTKEKGVFYTIDGYDFIIENGVANSIGIFATSTVIGKEMPEKWRELGFSWELSYNQWINLFNKLGYQVQVSQQPKVEVKHGRNTFTARLIVLKNNGKPVKLILNFLNYQGKTSPDDFGTLFYLGVAAR